MPRRAAMNSSSRVHSHFTGRRASWWRTGEILRDHLLLAASAGRPAVKMADRALHAHEVGEFFLRRRTSSGAHARPVVALPGDRAVGLQISRARGWSSRSTRDTSASLSPCQSPISLSGCRRCWRAHDLPLSCRIGGRLHRHNRIEHRGRIRTQLRAPAPASAAPSFRRQRRRCVGRRSARRVGR